MKKSKVYILIIAVLLVAVLAEAAWINSLRAGAADASAGQGNESGQGQEDWDFEYDTELSEGFEDALSDGSVEVWFQPIADPASGKTVGAEALSRWKDGDEYISPSVFVSVLEDTGQVTDLDKNVFTKACEFQSKRQSDGAELFPISVNLSVVSASQDGVAGEYEEIFSGFDIPAGCINVEITETIDSEKDVIASAASEFRSAGFKVEFDDFGAGYAAYSNLAVIPYDVLKIDKSLIDQIGTDRGNILVSNILEMAKDLDLYVIAEGVETGDQAEYLRSAGCDGIQGYYYSKPLPENEFIDYLAKS